MSKKLKITDCAGEEKGEYAIPPECMELEKGAQAVHDVVVAFLAGNRAGTASTKTKAEVRGGKAKPFRQKGLGRARAGAKSSPIWTGGGVAFGPKPRSYGKHVNKKVRTLALKRAFSERLEQNSVRILDQLKLDDHKTKTFISILKKLGVEGKTLVVVDDYDENLLKASGNVASVMLIKAASVNVYQLLHHTNVLFTKEAMDRFVGRLK
ncbi:MAG: 50S ribosomal protein L4 [Kiritimatiellaeota bacterium]|nr:50S ribosomal protein L4 [Kiritimatiellota bacterium]